MERSYGRSEGSLMGRLIEALMPLLKWFAVFMNKPKPPTAKEVHDEHLQTKEKRKQADAVASPAGSADRLRKSRYNRDRKR